MSFMEFWMGSVGTAVLLLMILPMAFSRERPVATMLIAAVGVVGIILPLLYFLVWYFTGGVI